MDSLNRHSFSAQPFIRAQAGVSQHTEPRVDHALCLQDTTIYVYLLSLDSGIFPYSKLSSAVSSHSATAASYHPMCSRSATPPPIYRS